ncbi:low temperature requirement protein A [Paraconexibacter algicola]|nr:low temperature requirement protein A [Paraconexibacter algicola]
MGTRTLPDDDPMLVPQTHDEAERKVTALELFFDLVFVFAFTQVTAAMAANPSAEGLARGMLVLGAVWWAWVGYAWLTNAIDPEEGVTRLVFFAVMASMLVVSLAIPEAFDDDAVVFAGAYAVVRFLQIGLYALSDDDVDLRHAVQRLGTTTAISCGLLLAAAFTDGTLQGALWALALLIDFGGGLLSGTGGWRVSAGHFAERHGLIVIIALGESIVALGVGASEEELTGPVVLAAVLGTALTAALWWVYFDVVALVAERHLHEATGAVRNAMARDSYSYIHLLMIAGIVLVALGIKKTLGEVDEPLKTVPAVALCGGAALYLVGHVLFRLRNVRTVAWRRIAAAALCLALIPLAREIDALVTLTAITAVYVVMIAYEAVRYAEARDRIRHMPA